MKQGDVFAAQPPDHRLAQVLHSGTPFGPRGLAAASLRPRSPRSDPPTISPGRPGDRQPQRHRQFFHDVVIQLVTNTPDHSRRRGAAGPRRAPRRRSTPPRRRVAARSARVGHDPLVVQPAPEVGDQLAVGPRHPSRQSAPRRRRPPVSDTPPQTAHNGVITPDGEVRDLSRVFLCLRAGQTKPSSHMTWRSHPLPSW